jgi:hypothetical protein
MLYQSHSHRIFFARVKKKIVRLPTLRDCGTDAVVVLCDV